MRFLSTCAISFRNFYIISDIINEKKKEVEHDKNSGKIEAGGNISGRFFENTEVIAKGDLQCNYILNCRVLTYGMIFVEGPIGSIIGGDVTGVMGISTTSCGHESNVKTLLRVGSTKEIRKEYAAITKEIRLRHC